jgi:hypothetical protein
VCIVEVRENKIEVERRVCLCLVGSPQTTHSRHMPLYQTSFSGVLDPLQKMCLRSCGDATACSMLPTVLEVLDRIQALFERDQRQKTRGTSQVDLNSPPEVCQAKRKSSFHVMIHSGRFLEVFVCRGMMEAMVTLYRLLIGRRLRNLGKSKQASLEVASLLSHVHFS